MQQIVSALKCELFIPAETEVSMTDKKCFKLREKGSFLSCLIPKRKKTNQVKRDRATKNNNEKEKC